MTPMATMPQGGWLPLNVRRRILATRIPPWPSAINQQQVLINAPQQRRQRGGRQQQRFGKDQPGEHLVAYRRRRQRCCRHQRRNHKGRIHALRDCPQARNGNSTCVGVGRDYGLSIRSELQAVEKRRSRERLQFFGHVKNARLLGQNWIRQTMKPFGAADCRGKAMTLRCALGRGKGAGCGSGSSGNSDGAGSAAGDSCASIGNASDSGAPAVLARDRQISGLGQSRLRVGFAAIVLAGSPAVNCACSGRIRQSRSVAEPVASASRSAGKGSAW